MKREIYLQFDFLVTFYQEKPDHNLTELDEKQKLWLDFHHFLSEDNLEVTIGLEIENFESLKSENPFLLYFHNLFGQGKDIYLNTAPFNNLEEQKFYESGSFCKLFALTESEPYCTNKMAQYGFIFINNDTLYKRLRTLSIKSLEDNRKRVLKFGEKTGDSIPQLKSWADLQEYAHPLNAIIICDRYLLKSEYGLIENLIPILKNLINPATPTDILILGNEFRISLSKIEEKFKEELQNFKVNLSICKVSLHESHDRMIFTNYFYIKSGQSFNFFKNGAINADLPSTTVEFSPLTGQNSWLIAIDFLEELKKSLPKIDQIGTEIRSIGNKQNRLLA